MGVLGDWGKKKKSTKHEGKGRKVALVKKKKKISLGQGTMIKKGKGTDNLPEQRPIEGGKKKKV